METDKTPKSKNKPLPKLKIDQTTTPTNRKCLSMDQDYSPIYFPSTQESNEEIDVFWDWHSPSDKRRSKKQKRLLPSAAPSPKYPIKRHPSNQNFEKLRYELKLLREQLAIPDDESSLCVSPQQETEFKETEEQPFDDFYDDLFDDSVDDEQLVLFSQRVEADLAQNATPICDNKEVVEEFATKFDDSFDMVLSNFELDAIETKPNVIQTPSGMLEVYRTKSFEITDSQNNGKCTLEEIERKRLEALSKLKSKNKLEISELKCSQEEIEKKRLQALAKLDAKRLQDIERKRQEALKRLQATRMRNAGLVKSTLSKKF